MSRILSLYSRETTPRELHPALESSVQERRGFIEGHPEEGHTNDQRDGVTPLYKTVERGETEDDFYELEKENQKYEDIRSEKKFDYKENDSMRNNEGAEGGGCRTEGEGGAGGVETRRGAEPGPAAEPSPATSESIPRQPPAEPQEDAGDHAAFPSKAEEEELDSGKEKLVVGEPASTAAAPAPVTSPAASFESSEGFEWPLGTLEPCLLIVMGITMLACIQSVFYPQPLHLILRVKQS
ncbi:uncharacterized protein LOC134173183 [Pezoporus occidentalis]|uniref:uncharacterized protein LOC134173183 n=1 Tax=Pezoporus occidentalis TaxID=407982 RepID=UPI002F90EBB6